MGTSILTQRAGTDANAPESPRKAIFWDWHVGTLALQMLENPGKCTRINSKKYENLFFTGPGLDEMSNGCIVLDKKMYPDLLEALKPFGDSSNTSNGGFGVTWDAHLYGLRACLWQRQMLRQRQGVEHRSLRNKSKWGSQPHDVLSSWARWDKGDGESRVRRRRRTLWLY